MPTHESKYLTVKKFCHKFTWCKQTYCKRLVEDVDVCFCSEQSFDKADLGNQDGEADEESQAGSEDEDSGNHLLMQKYEKKKINIGHCLINNKELSLNYKSQYGHKSVALKELDKKRL